MKTVYTTHGKDNSQLSVVSFTIFLELVQHRLRKLSADQEAQFEWFAHQSASPAACLSCIMLSGASFYDLKLV